MSDGSEFVPSSVPLLTIGYSTLASRMGAIVLPPAQPDVQILVVVQGTPIEKPSCFSGRPDVHVVVDDGLGVTRSRNIVLERASGRYLAFGDDDASWRLDGVRQVVAAMDAEPELAMVLAMAADEAGSPRKRYPNRPHRLTRWNSAKAGTIELVVRTAAFDAASVRFDEEFGAGSDNFLGDEYILIADALSAGLRGRFLPIVISEHPSESSGSAFGTPEDAEVRSRVFDRVFGRWAPLARLAFLARRPRRFGSVGLGWRFVRGRFASGDSSSHR